MDTAFIAVCIFAAALWLLHCGIYYVVVLLRLGDEGRRVGSHAVFATWGQQRYINAYLELLSGSEKQRWYNVYIRYSRTLQLMVWALAMAVIIVRIFVGTEAGDPGWTIGR